MSAGIQIDSNAAEILKGFHRLQPAAQTAVVKRVKGALLVVESKVRTGAGVRWQRGMAGLAGRLTSYSKAADERTMLDAAIGFRKYKGFPYELSQEYGAKASPGKAMAIPVTPKARAAGSPRNFPGGLVLIKDTKNAVLVSRAKKVKSLKDFQAGGEIQYVLVKSIKGRLGFRKTVLDNVSLLSEAIVEGYQDGMREASSL